jgi:uncharacterized SAM-binding protein YcdF (DUF218 family)
LTLPSRRPARPARRLGCGCLPLSLLFLAAIIGVWLFPAPFLTFLGKALVEDDGAQKADAILVLGGDEFGTRILKGAELAKAGYAPIVLVSGPAALLGHTSDATIEFAERKGFPASLFRAVPLPPGADSTRSEADFLGKYLRDSNLQRILLVTSNYHSRRAARTWRHENPRLAVDVIPAPDPDFTPGTWWQSRHGKKTFLYEWMKTISSWFGN